MLPVTTLLFFKCECAKLLYFYFRLKSDITMMFLDPISHMTQEFWRFDDIIGKKWHICVCKFQDLLAENGGFWRGGKIVERLVQC